MPEAPLLITITVSLVDMQPSLSTRSKLSPAGLGQLITQPAGSTTASVVINTSMVARPGASMPAPLAMPPTDQPSSASWPAWPPMSVVMIASAAACPPSG